MCFDYYLKMGQNTAKQFEHQCRIKGVQNIGTYVRNNGVELNVTGNRFSIPNYNVHSESL